MINAMKPRRHEPNNQVFAGGNTRGYQRRYHAGESVARVNRTTCIGLIKSYRIDEL